MKKFLIFSILAVVLSMTVYAQKDKNAWKEEQNMEQQYIVFKKNLDYWDGKYILNERQFNEFYAVFSDSVEVLENEISDKVNQISALQDDLDATNTQLKQAKAELNTSIKNQEAIEVFGQNIDKRFYTIIVYSIILVLLVMLGAVFILYKRSNTVTVRTKKDFDELKEEFDTHKKNALERYTKINTELHNTRMEMKNN